MLCIGWNLRITTNKLDLLRPAFYIFGLGAG